MPGEFFDNRLGQHARGNPCALCQHHRGVGRQIAMRGIARRFERDIGKRRARGQHAVGHQFGKGGFDDTSKGGVKRFKFGHDGLVR